MVGLIKKWYIILTHDKIRQERRYHPLWSVSYCHDMRLLAVTLFGHEALSSLFWTMGGGGDQILMGGRGGRWLCI